MQIEEKTILRKMTKTIIVETVILMVIIFGMIFKCCKGGGDGEPSTIVKTDTVTFTKTDTVWKTTTNTIRIPEPVEKVVIRRDTVEKELEYAHLTYKGDTVLKDSAKLHYQADITGCNASLDSLSWQITYPQITNNNQTIITNEITKYKKPKITFGVGIGAGYGIINKKADIFVGGTLQIPIFSK